MPASTETPSRRPNADRPTLLMVGQGDPMDVALRHGLDRHGLFVEVATLPEIARVAQLAAPDVVLLIGDASDRGGETALSALAADPATRSLPVILLSNDRGLESRLRAFRHGAMAVVPRSASADAVAAQIATLTRDLGDRFEDQTGEIGEATFDELVELVKKELRSGILSVHAPGHQGGPLRVVLGAGRPVADAVQEFVGRLKPHVSEANAVPYQFHASSGGAVELLGLNEGSIAEPSPVAFEGARLLLVEDDPGRADTLAQELRSRGAVVFVTSSVGKGLERAAGLDPQAVLVDASGLEGPEFKVIRAIRRHLRLRWATILVTPWADVWPEGAPRPELGPIAAKVGPLLAAERELIGRSRGKRAFDVRMESFGPARLLRVLTSESLGLRITIHHTKTSLEVDLAEGLVVGAVANAGPKRREGTSALAVLLALGSARARIEPSENPKAANIMAPAEEALAVAAEEASAIARALAGASHLPSKRGQALDGDDLHVPFEEDDELPHDAQTRIKDLAGLARAGEVLLDENTETVRPSAPEAPAAAPAAQRKAGTAPRRPPAIAPGRRTLVMGTAPPPAEPPTPGPAAQAIAVPPPLPGGPAPTPPTPSTPRPGPTAPTTAPRAEPTVPGSAAPTLDPPFPDESVPPPPGPEIPPAVPESAPPAGGLPNLVPAGDAFAAPIPEAERQRAAREPTEIVAHEPPPKRAGAGTWLLRLFLLLIAFTALLAVAAFAYRASDLREPTIDRLFADLGFPRDEGPVTPDPVPETDEGPAPIEGDPIEADPIDPVDPIAPPDAPAGEDEDPTAVVEGDPEDETPDAEGRDGDDESEAVTDDEDPEELAEDAADADEPGEDDDAPIEGADAAALVAQARRAPPAYAERLYRRALELDANEHHAMTGLARILMDRNEPAEAAELLRGAVRRRPRRAIYRVWLGDALSSMGDGAGAQREWQQALEVEPNNRLARSRLGR